MDTPAASPRLGPAVTEAVEEHVLDASGHFDVHDDPIDLGQYTFEVYTHANKHQIAEAVEQTFKVTVRRVNTQTYRGKNKKSRQGRPSVGSDYKKAIVTLKAGDKIELV